MKSALQVLFAMIPPAFAALRERAEKGGTNEAAVAGDVDGACCVHTRKAG
jgi:hypothetical protein